MPLILTERQPDLEEEMDRDDCDPELLFNTYKQFARINDLLSDWKKIYRNYLKPRMNKAYDYRLLDIGFGGGDIPLLLSRLAKKDGFNLNITAIEADERAYKFSKNLPQDPKVLFRHCRAEHMINYGETFDFVISNHLLHHLDDKYAVEKILREAEQLSTRFIVFSDIRRSDIGYAAFKYAAPFLFRNSYIVEDGLTSIKRSFTKSELKHIVPNTWKVSSNFPFRLLLTYPK
jgi:2-polyprenyl-3-methyl-5-hydroxy-6-metoxy-1,4-benzoquinol methylase